MAQNIWKFGCSAVPHLGVLFTLKKYSDGRVVSGFIWNLLFLTVKLKNQPGDKQSQNKSIRAKTLDVVKLTIWL